MPAKVADPEVLPLGPITRSRARKFKEVLSLTYTKLSDSFDDVSALDNKLFNVLHTNVEDKEYDVGVLSLARLKFRSSYPFQLNKADTLQLARFSSIQLNVSSTSSTQAEQPGTHVADPKVFPQGPVTRSKAKQFREVLSLTCAKLLDSFDNVCALDRERTRDQELKPSSVEAWRFVCSSFQLNEADTPSSSSIQLISALFSSTSALLAQLKLNNPKAGETRPTCGGVSHGFRDTYDPLGAA
ncbi:hypothetical protein GQ457_08G031250 [Hibiscus cannabinus]